MSFNGSRGAGVGVDERSSGDEMSSLLSCRLKYADEGLSGERSGERSGDLWSRYVLKSFTLPFWSVFMRLWCAPLISDLSGEDAGVSRFDVYEESGALSRARSTICLAAAAIPADVLALVGLWAPGLSGSGGGARSGSELSHLRLIDVSSCILPSSFRLVWYHTVVAAKVCLHNDKAFYSHRHARSPIIRAGMLMSDLSVA